MKEKEPIFTDEHRFAAPYRSAAATDIRETFARVSKLSKAAQAEHRAAVMRQHHAAIRDEFVRLKEKTEAGK